ncbi:MAG: hypothetical protein GX596_04605 [Propionibacterium sp.]|nr:hypothetical protein [Propionibacterium sp.]
MTVEPGDESRLEAASGWHSIWRMQFVAEVEGHEFVLEADVLDSGDHSYLYRDGIQVAVGTGPTRFALADHLPAPARGEVASSAVIESRIGWIGMRRAHLLDGDVERPLAPLPGTWEAGRTRRRRRWPALAPVVTSLVLLVLVAALVIEGAQSLQWVTRSEWFSGISGWRFQAPWDLPLTANIVITLVGIAALAIGALRLRRTWLQSETDSAPSRLKP